jgi:trk system potassium uptake protein
MLRLKRSRSTAGSSRSPVPIRHPGRTLVLMFLGLIAFGALLLYQPFSVRGEQLDWSSALMASSAAVCVTGLHTVETGTTFSFVGQLVLLVLIQVGGLSYMAASSLLYYLFRRQPTVHDRLLLRQTLGQVTLQDTQRVLFMGLKFALAVEAIGAVILTARFSLDPNRTLSEAIWFGIFHSVSAFCNGGIDLFDVDGFSSLEGFRGDLVVNGVVMALVILGGLGFAVCYEIMHHRRRRAWSLHTRIVLIASGALIALGAGVILLAEWTNPATLGPLPLGEKLLAGLFQSVILRTAGFSTIEIGDVRSITLLMIGIFAFIGGSPGGTAGGIKTTTFAVTLIAIYSSLACRHEPEIMERRLSNELIFRGLLIIFLSFGAIVVGIVLLTFTEPEALLRADTGGDIFMNLQFEVISAFTTVGLSRGITPHLTEMGRIVLMVLMVVGRLGPLTVATAWTAPGAAPRRHLPEENVSVG